MSYLIATIVRKSCVFVLEIRYPLDTVRILADFFKNEGILVTVFKMHRHRNGDAMVIVHSQIEKGKEDEVAEKIEALPDVLRMEKYSNPIIEE